MNILITGGSSGIGKYLAEALSKKNTIITCSRSNKKLFFTKKNINITNYFCDISNENSVINFAKELKIKKIDVIINCAGTYGGIGKFYNIEFNSWKKAIETNFFGIYLICKHFLKFFKKSKIKKIINFSGGGAFNAFPNYSSYATSKAAVVRFTETIAVELKSKKISANCIAPGFVATNIHKETIRSGPQKSGKKFYNTTLKNLKSNSTPLEKIYKCVNFLISKKAKLLNGKTISVNFDPWNEKKFQKNIKIIKNTDVLTMRRINFKNTL
jgi:NAD(P)-dependent dehydrogenase (short-subunit alcohol dehydrogenase family)